MGAPLGDQPEQPLSAGFSGVEDAAEALGGIGLPAAAARNRDGPGSGGWGRSSRATRASLSRSGTAAAASRRSAPVTSDSSSLSSTIARSPGHRDSFVCFGRPPASTPPGLRPAPDSRPGRRCRRPPETPSTVPDPADRRSLAATHPAARPREISSRSANDNRSSHRRRGTGRIPPVRFSRSRTVDGMPAHLPRPAPSPPDPTATAARPHRPPPATTPSAPSGHHPIPSPRAKIMKCCDDPLRPPA